MKRGLIFLFIAALLIPMCASAETLPAAVNAIRDRGELRIGTKDDVPGFGERDDATGNYRGLDIELSYLMARAIWPEEDPEAVKAKVVFTPVTAKTRGVLLDEGSLDMVIATYTIKPDRLLNYGFSKPYYVDSIGLMVKADSGIAGFSDLDGKTVGVAQGATTKDVLTAAAEAAGIALNFEELSDYPLLKSALLEGKVDCFSVDKSILGGYLDDQTLILPDSFEEGAQPYGVALRKSDAELLAFVDGVIEKARQDGAIDQIVSEHPVLAPINWDQVDRHAETIWAEYELLK